MTGFKLPVVLAVALLAAPTQIRNSGIVGAPISLLDNGAPCDGTNDDQPALVRAQNKLPGVGGVIDARGCKNGLTISTGFSITKPGTVLLLPAAVVTLNAYLDILAPGVHVIGMGINTSKGVVPSATEATTVEVATTAGIRFGAAATNIWNWSLERLTVEPKAAATPAFGVQLWNARQGLVDHVETTSFTTGTGVLVNDNCWSNRFYELMTTSNDVGLKYAGLEPNANVHVGGLYNSNRIGIYVALGTGTTAGIYVVGGAQFEQNTDSGIYIQSGNINGFHVLGAYSELLSGAKRLLTAKSNGTQAMRLAYLDVAGVSVLAQGTVNPVLLDSTATAGDFINAHVDMLGYGMTGGATALVDAVGANTLARVEGKALSGSSITPFHTVASSAKALSTWFDGSGLNFKNASDSAMQVNIDSGLTAGQSSILTFRDRGANKHVITSVGGSLYFNDTGAGLNKLIIGAGNAPTNLNSGGGLANGVQINATTNAGSGGLEVWTGGTAPARGITIGTGGTTFATLGTPANLTITGCSDCTIANPCAGGGTGAIAKRLNGVWVCN